MIYYSFKNTYVENMQLCFELLKGSEKNSNLNSKNSNLNSKVRVIQSIPPILRFEFYKV